MPKSADLSKFDQKGLKILKTIINIKSTKINFKYNLNYYELNFLQILHQ